MTTGKLKFVDTVCAAPAICNGIFPARSIDGSSLIYCAPCRGIASKIANAGLTEKSLNLLPPKQNDVACCNQYFEGRCHPNHHQHLKVKQPRLFILNEPLGCFFMESTRSIFESRRAFSFKVGCCVLRRQPLAASPPRDFASEVVIVKRIRR